MNLRNGHPLDIDLVAFMEGNLNAGERDFLKAHASECLLCRIRLRRISEASIPDWEGDSVQSRSVEFPRQVLSVLESPQVNVSPAPGQLWLAGRENHLMVWIRKLMDNRLICHAVTLDVDLADNRAVKIDQAKSPIGVDLVLWRDIIGDVDKAALYRFLGSLDAPAEMDALQSEVVVPENEWLESDATSQLIEYRQILADRLAELSDQLHEEPDAGKESELDHVYREIEADLAFRRGSMCRVSKTDDEAIEVLAMRLGGQSIAKVVESTCVVLVLALDLRLVGTSAKFWDLAKEIGDRSNATALAITDPAQPHETLVYEQEDMAESMGAPSGNTLAPSPRQGSLAIGDALFKYLEAASMPLETDLSGDSSLPNPDLRELITSAAEEVIGKKAKAKGPNQVKNRALDSLTMLEAQRLAEAISAAGVGMPLVPAIQELSRGR